MMPTTSTTTSSNVTTAKGSVEQAQSAVDAGQKEVEAAKARLTTAQARQREAEATAAIVRWLDVQGKPIGVSSVRDDDFDVRGDVATIRDRTRVFPSHEVALRIAPTVTGCGTAGPAVLPIAGGRVTVWPE